MHEFPPLMKVMLLFTVNQKLHDQRRERMVITYRFAYIPGICASSTALGRGCSHRSGFHSPASSPQIALFVLHACTLRKMVVPSGTGTSLTMVPSVQRTGSESGRTVLTLALRMRGVGLSSSS